MDIAPENTPESKSSKISNIYILPCLQEFKAYIENSTFEPEQIPADPSYLDKYVVDGKINQLTAVTSASDEFDKIWWKNANDELKKKYEQHGIIIPNMNLDENYKKDGLMSSISINDKKITECGNITIEDKWKMYIEFLNNEFQKSDTTDANAAFIISHHNRMKGKDEIFGFIHMKGKDEMIGLIPFNKGFENYSF